MTGNEDQSRYYRAWESAMKRADREGGPRRYPRRVVFRAGTIAALGGASILPALLAACSGGSSKPPAPSAATSATKPASAGGAAASPGAASGSAAGGSSAVSGDISAATNLPPLADGQFKYSRYPLVEKYNYRNLQWGGTPTQGGNLVSNPLQPPNWNILAQPSMNNYGGRLFNTLGHIVYGTGIDMEKVQLAGDLAAKWPPEATPDGMSFTYTLNQGVKFANIAPVNGREMTSADVKSSYETYAAKSIWSAKAATIDHIEAPDKYTVKFVMKEPSAYWPAFTSEATFFIFAAEALQNMDQFISQPIGTGPFILKESPQSDHFLMVRNPDYWKKDANGRQLPYIDSTRQNWITDYSVELAAYRAGQQDFTGPPNLVQLHAIVTSVPDSIIEVIPKDPAVQAALVFQMKNPIFQDVRVRRAMNMALDREAIFKTAWQGACVPAEPVPYDYQGLTEPTQLKDQGQWVKYDAAMAKKLLADAGHPNGFKTTLIYSNTLAADYLTVYQQAQGYWQQIGITVDLVVQELTTWTQTQLNKTFDGLFGITTVAGYDGDTMYQLYHTDAPLNSGSWSEPQTEDLLKQERALLDATKRQAVFKDLNAHLLDVVPAMFIGARHRTVALHPWVRGIEDHIHSWGGYWGSWQQSIAWMLPTAPNGRGGKAI